MTKQFSNYSDLLTFTRASKGHALRPVSYGTELVTNGDYSNGTTGWTNDSSLTMDTFEVASGRLHIENTAGTTQAAYTDDNISLVAGKIYKFTAELEKVSGNDNWDIDIRVAALSTVRHTMTSTATTETLQVIFVATQTENTVIQITTRDTFEGYIDNVSVKEVFFDQTDGTLTLFEHPNNVPRVEWDADRNRLGLLVEEQRINLVYGSTSPPTDGSSKNPSNKILSPTQEVNADLVVENTSTSAHGVRRTNVFPTQGATDYTISVFAKAKERRYLQLRMYANGTSNDVFGFDLQEGTAPAGGSIQDVGNGWYRCSATLSVDNSTGGFNFAAAQMGSDSLTYYYAGDGSSGMYMFGLQVEAGSFPTSYIKNEGLSGGVTRSADVASIPVADFGFNADAGSLLVEFNSGGSDGGDYPHAFSLDGSTTNDAIRVGFNTANLKQFVVRKTGTNQCVLNNGTYSPSDQLKMSVAYKENDFASSDNGDSVVTDTSGTLPTVSTLSIGKWQSGNYANGHIKSIQYYPRRLTDAQLQALTEPRSTPTLSLTFDGLESSYTENYIHG